MVNCRKKKKHDRKYAKSTYIFKFQVTDTDNKKLQTHRNKGVCELLETTERVGMKQLANRLCFCSRMLIRKHHMNLTVAHSANAMGARCCYANGARGVVTLDDAIMTVIVQYCAIGYRYSHVQHRHRHSALSCLWVKFECLLLLIIIWSYLLVRVRDSIV